MQQAIQQSIQQTEQQGLFLAGFALYLLAMIALGWWVSRRSKGAGAQSGEDFLLGGRALPFWLMLIGLAISCATNPAAQIAMERLIELNNCEMHMTHMVTPGDEAGLRRVGIRCTSDPFFASSELFIDA